MKFKVFTFTAQNQFANSFDYYADENSESPLSGLVGYCLQKLTGGWALVYYTAGSFMSEYRDTDNVMIYPNLIPVGSIPIIVGANVSIDSNLLPVSDYLKSNRASISAVSFEILTTGVAIQFWSNNSGIPTKLGSLFPIVGSTSGGPISRITSPSSVIPSGTSFARNLYREPHFIKCSTGNQCIYYTFDSKYQNGPTALPNEGVISKSWSTAHIPVGLSLLYGCYVANEANEPEYSYTTVIDAPDCPGDYSFNQATWWLEDSTPALATAEAIESVSEELSKVLTQQNKYVVR